MSYCTNEDIRNQIEEARLVQLTDDEGTGTVEEDRVTQAIADANSEIDGYLGLRMKLPLAPVPVTLQRLAIDIAVYNLYSRREKIPEHRAERYRNAIRFLEGVVAGKISLGSADPDGNPLAPNAPEMAKDNPERAFTRSTLTGF
ncbi:MAG: DUF1320 domain-containing protein [Desulfobacteraceae bacterium]|nr:DUF1320 domain-containing protein [Desulfobacteraceae bacterium]